MAKKTKKRGSLKLTIIPILVIMLIAYGASISFTIMRRTSNGFKAYLKNGVQAKGLALQAELETRGNELLKFSETIANSIEHSNDLAGLIRSGVKQAMAGYLAPHLESTGANEIYILNDKGIILYTATMKNYNPALLVSNISFKEVSSSNTKKATHLAKVGDRLSFVAVNKAGDYYVVFEKIFSTEETINYYSLNFACALTLFNDDVRVLSSLKDGKGERVVGTKLNNKEIYDKVYTQKQPYFGENKIMGEGYISLYMPIDTGDPLDKYMLFVGEPVSTFSSIMGGVQKISYLYVVLFTAFQVIVIILILHVLIFKPLGKVEKAVNRLAENTEDTDLTYRLNIKLNNELGALCDDVDEFIERLQNLIIDMKSAQDSLLGIGNNLGEASEQSASAIHQIMSNIESVRNQTVQQVSAMDKASAVVERNASEVDKLDDLIENQSAGLVESSASIEQMVGNIESVSGNIQKMNEQFKQLVVLTKQGQGTQTEVYTKVNEMAEQSKLLMQANAVISSIASKTNLLAMNAAIEAAHAGESGKGFSVVADEIRTLAANSSKQSVSIGEQLEQILKTIGEVVKASESSNKAFETITLKLTDTDNLVQEIDEAMEEQSSASKQVLDALRDINTATTEVQTSSKSMKQNSKNVNKEIETLTNLTHAISGSIDEMGTGAEHINIAAKGVSDMAEQTRSNINEVESLIGRFKV